MRFEAHTDARSSRRVTSETFGRLAEATLVDSLRQHGQIAISLVAEIEKEAIGHVVLSPVTLMPMLPGLRMLGLGPVAVLPRCQRNGVGSLLMKQAIEQARAEGWHALVVLGHPAYYARFGFVPANRFELRCEFDAPEEAFMALELQPGVLKGWGGTVRYQPEFSMV